jgi:hypothetical protein
MLKFQEAPLSRLTDGGTVGLIRIVATMIGAIADPAQWDARQAVVAQELAVAAIYGKQRYSNYTLIKFKFTWRHEIIA